MAGYRPEQDTLVVTRGADFEHVWQLAPGDADIPSGATARIEFTVGSEMNASIVGTWSGTVGTRTISFRKESSVIEAMADRLRYRLIITLPDDPDDLDVCLVYGNVHRHQ